MGAPGAAHPLVRVEAARELPLLEVVRVLDRLEAEEHQRGSTDTAKRSAVRRPFPFTAASSPIATVNELVTRTMVFTRPIQVSMERDAWAKPSG